MKNEKKIIKVKRKLTGTRKLLLILIGLLIGMLVAEVSVRVLVKKGIIEMDKSIENDTRIFSSKFGYINKPYSGRTHQIGKYKTSWNINKYGFRDYDYAPFRPNKTFRIMALGDSMTFGLGVESYETFPKVLETKINESSASLKFTEVLNISALGYGPNEYKNLFQTFGKVFKPKVVIVGFFLGNDSLDSLWVDLNKKYIFLKAIPDQIVPFKINEWLKGHSALWIFVLQKYYGWVETQSIDNIKLVFNGDIKEHMLRDVQIDPSSDFMKKSWQLTENYLNELITSASKSKAEVVILILPTREQILPDEWKKVKDQGHNVDERLYTDSAPRRKLLGICQKNNWDCLDLQDVFRNQDDLNSLFLNEDFHLSPKGHELVSDLLFGYLSERNLLEY